MTALKKARDKVSQEAAESGVEAGLKEARKKVEAQETEKETAAREFTPYNYSISTIPKSSDGELALLILANFFSTHSSIKMRSPKFCAKNLFYCLCIY